MLKALIVGFGRAGRGLHLPCLRKAALRSEREGLFAGEVGVIDPAAEAPAPGEAGGGRFFRDLEEARCFAPERTVVHVCTPPDAHLTALRRVAEYGYVRVVVEKPLATTPEGVEQTRRLARERGLDLLV